MQPWVLTRLSWVSLTANCVQGNLRLNRAPPCPKSASEGEDSLLPDLTPVFPWHLLTVASLIVVKRDSDFVRALQRFLTLANLQVPSCVRSGDCPSVVILIQLKGRESHLHAFPSLLCPII
jgi:hypothetical protein